MKIEGDVAAGYRAVDLDSFNDVLPAKAVLLMADDMTGEVRYRDVAGETKNLALGPHRIRLLPR